MTRHEGAREALIGAFPPPLPPPAQYWPFAACKTLLEERIGWVQEDALMLDDCDTVGGSLRYWSMVPILAAPFQRARTSRIILSQRSNGTSLPRIGIEKSIITPHASQPRIVLATFKCNTTSDCPRRPQCLVSPTALSTAEVEHSPRRSCELVSKI
jgi:hypothetical protein